MLGEVFYWVFNMSIVATITGIVVLLLRRIKKIPRRFILILWFIPLLRILIPVSVGSKYGLMEIVSKVTTKTVQVSENYEWLSMTNSTMAAETYFPITYKTNLLENIFTISSVIWAIIGIALLIAFGFMYVVTKIELKTAVYYKDNIWISDRVTGPAVYGILKPKIIIPKGYENSDITFIIAHENAHIRHKDNLWRLIGFITVAIHWFNPFAWMFLKRVLADIELACDERVLKKCGEKEKKAYAHPL